MSVPSIKITADWKHNPHLLMYKASYKIYIIVKLWNKHSLGLTYSNRFMMHSCLFRTQRIWNNYPESFLHVFDVYLIDVVIRDIFKNYGESSTSIEVKLSKLINLITKVQLRNIFQIMDILLNSCINSM